MDRGLLVLVGVCCYSDGDKEGVLLFHICFFVSSEINCIRSMLRSYTIYNT
jgi:hypothetical protein